MTIVLPEGPQGVSSHVSSFLHYQSSRYPPVVHHTVITEEKYMRNWELSPDIEQNGPKLIKQSI